MAHRTSKEDRPPMARHGRIGVRPSFDARRVNTSNVFGFYVSAPRASSLPEMDTCAALYTSLGLTREARLYLLLAVLPPLLVSSFAHPARIELPVFATVWAFHLKQMATFVCPKRWFCLAWHGSMLYATCKRTRSQRSHHPQVFCHRRMFACGF